MYNWPRLSRRRPQRTENIRHVLFRASNYDTQMKKKFEISFEGISSSEFPKVLHHYRVRLCFTCFESLALITSTHTHTQMHFLRSQVMPCHGGVWGPILWSSYSLNGALHILFVSVCLSPEFTGFLPLPKNL